MQVGLEREGIEAPRGSPRWSRDTIRNMVREEAYLPHSPEELQALAVEELLSEEVYSGFDPILPYDVVAYYGRTRSSYASRHTKKPFQWLTKKKAEVCLPRR